MLVVKVVKAVIVRAALFLHILISVWRVTVDKDDEQFWYLGLAAIPLLLESFYTIVKRKGDDFLLFTPCFFFYLLTTVPCVWLLELRKTDVYLAGTQDVLFNSTHAHKDTVADAVVEDVNLDINPNTWTILLEEMLLYLLIIGRWLLPRGKVTREQLTELLFAFIGVAADTMEFLSLFGEDVVRSGRTLSYCVLSVWTLSVMQFCMTLTVTHRPRRGKNIRVYEEDEDKEKQGERISNEVIAILLSMIMQDVPFLTVRLYTIITYNIINYSLIFFTSKNCLVILLLIYKIAVLVQKKYCPEKKSDKKSIEDQEFHVIGSENELQEKKNKSDRNKNGSGYKISSKEKKRLEKSYKLKNEKKSSRLGSSKRGHFNHGNNVALSTASTMSLNRSPAGSNLATPQIRPKSAPNTQNSKRLPTQQQTPQIQNNRSPAAPTKELPKMPARPADAAPATQKQALNVQQAAPEIKTNSQPSKPGIPMQTPQNKPKQQTLQPQPAAPPSSKVVNTPQGDLKQPPTVATGFGWISSKPKDDDVIVAGLS